jgi:hypothetical protein
MQQERGRAGGHVALGAPSAKEAATMFMGAVKAQDLQAMGAVWGSEQGAARDHMDRTELDKRLVILQSCYDHDRAQILDEQAGPNGQRVVRVQVTRGGKTKVPQFKVARVRPTAGTSSTPTTTPSPRISAEVGNRHSLSAR